MFLSRTRGFDHWDTDSTLKLCGRMEKVTLSYNDIVVAEGDLASKHRIFKLWLINNNSQPTHRCQWTTGERTQITFTLSSTASVVSSSASPSPSIARSRASSRSARWAIATTLAPSRS